MRYGRAGLMARLLSVHPFHPRASEHHRRWCGEIRARRAELVESRSRVGIDGQMCWASPDHRVAIVRTEGPDPARAIAQLAEPGVSDFDRWYRAEEQAIHGCPLRDAGSAELLADYSDAPADPFDLFVAAALPLLPGRTDAYVEQIALGVQSGDGQRRLDRWKLTRMSIWLHRYPGGPHREPVDFVIYELTGDIPGMLRTLASADDGETLAQRALLRDNFGTDPVEGNLPFPQPAFAWSSEVPA